MSFDRPALSTLIERNRNDLDGRLAGADSRLRHAVLDVLGRTHSGAAAGIYGYIDWIAKQIIPDTADAEMLTRFASRFNIRRKASVVATGAVTLSGTDGTIVAAGTELIRADGTVYQVDADVTLAAGTATAQITSQIAGSSANQVSGTLTFVSPIAGAQAIAVIHGSGIVGGAEEEDVDSLLSRLLQRLRKSPEGGSDADYERWLLAISFVTRCWVYPLWMGAGTVGLTFVCDGRSDIIPTTDDIEDVVAIIAAQKPVTANVVVFAPTPQPHDLYIRLNPDDTATRAAVTAELEDMFRRDATPGGTLYLSRISEAISLAAGENNHVLELPSQPIVSPPGEIAMLGNIVWLS